MPAIRHSSKRKPPPEGFEDIESDLLVFANKMKDAQNKPPPAGPRHQAQWEIFQISHQRSRYVYELYYEKEAISKKLYDFLLKNGYADAMLIAKWKKQGYEKVSSSCFPLFDVSSLTLPSSAVCAVSRQRRQTLTALVSAESRERR
jgi:bud site selection protein 31